MVKRWLMTAYLLVAGWLLLVPASAHLASSPALVVDDVVVEGSTKMPGKLVFDNTESDPPFSKYAGYKEDRGKAPFDHQQHVEYEGSTCVVCHHTNSKTLVANDGVASELVMRCTVCHTDQDKAPSPVEGTNEDHKFKDVPAVEAEAAYHGIDNSQSPASEAGCITCHKRLEKAFPKAGKVVSCSSCHTGQDS
jgi:hypothetical protein